MDLGAIYACATPDCRSYGREFVAMSPNAIREYFGRIGDVTCIDCRQPVQFRRLVGEDE